MQKAAVSPQQLSFLNQMMQQAGQEMPQSAGTYGEFLGPQGGQAMTNQANQNFQQQTLPSIMEAMGTGSKGSSALNQAMGAAGSNMNTDLAALLSQLKLSAAGGLAGLSTGQAQMGTQTPQFSYMQKQQPFWQSALLGGLNLAGKVGGALV